MTQHNSKIRPEWQPAIVGWRNFVTARPDLRLTSGRNGLNWFIRNHRQRALRSRVMCKINGMWLCDIEKFPSFVFDVMLEASVLMPNSGIEPKSSQKGCSND